MHKVHLLDYVAGNVRSLANAIEKLGYTIEWVKEPKDVKNAEVSGQLRAILRLGAESGGSDEVTDGYLGSH